MTYAPTTNPNAKIVIVDETFLREVHARASATPVWTGSEWAVGPSRARTEIELVFLDFVGGISDNFSANYLKYSVLGRHSPHLAFSGTSERTIKFVAHLIDQTQAGESLDGARFLQALTLPWRRRGLPDIGIGRRFEQAESCNPPPLVRLQVFPKTFLNEVGVLRRVEISKMAPINQGVDELEPMVLGFVEVSIEFVVTYYEYDLRNYPDYRLTGGAIGE